VQRVARLKRVAKLALTAVGALVYVWFEAVRLAPLVKRRKRRRRRAQPGG
jgi:hypothetical protein